MQDIWLQIRQKFPDWGLIFPAGFPDISAVKKGMERLNQLSIGLTVINIPDASSGLFALKEKDLIAEWMELVQNPSISLLISARGGVGSIRLASLVESMNLPVPSIPIIGFSDLTALFWKLYVQHGRKNIYGPVLAYHFAKFEDWETSSQFAGLLNGEKTTDLPKNDSVIMITQKEDKVRGTLIPACFSVLVETMDTIETEEPFIFVLEDVNEKVHRLVRYLYLLENKGYLNNCRAIVLGDFIGTEKIEIFYNEVKNMAEKYGFWAIRNFPFGHHLHSVSLPFGVKATLDMKERQLRWDEFLS